MDYESAALPLSYLGLSTTYGNCALRFAPFYYSGPVFTPTPILAQALNLSLAKIQHAFDE